MKCPNCGAEVDGKFCEFCGAKVEKEQTVAEEIIMKAEPISEPCREDYGSSKTTYYVPHSNIAPRSIVLAVVLSFVTCGLYGIYWMIKINDEINELAGEPGATSGGMVFLFDLITCGIYGLYWMYKMGERCDAIKRTNGSSGILYLILALFGFGIISYCLMQDTVNKAVS